MKISLLRKDEKPREKLQSLGPDKLSEAELFALIIRNGGLNESAIEVSQSLLNRFGSLKNLATQPLESLMTTKNLGYAKASSLIASIELAKRLATQVSDEFPTIKKPADIYDFVRPKIFNLQKEILYLICINSRNKITSIDIVTTGTLDQTIVHPRDIFKIALQKNAHGIFLVHNHPSNQTTPSNEDFKATERIIKVGSIIGIPLIDHLVVCDHAFESIKSLLSCMKGGEIK